MRITVSYYLQQLIYSDVAMYESSEPCRLPYPSPKLLRA